MTEPIKHIDIEKVIKEGDSKLLKRIPKFIVKKLIKIVKQEELNDLLFRLKEYDGVDFLEKVIEDFNITLDVEGLENLPDNPKNFFVANHPYGLLDGLIITTIVGRKYGDLRAIGNDAFRFIPNLHSLITNVSVFGTNSRQGLKELEEVYSSNIPITHFPYGLVSRISKFKIQDKFWKKSFINKSITHKRDVVPIRFYGRNSKTFYCIFLLRTMFRIKATIELMLLPSELWKKTGATVKVKIHEVIPSSTFDKTHSHLEWAQIVKDKIYNKN